MNRTGKLLPGLSVSMALVASAAVFFLPAGGPQQPPPGPLSGTPAAHGCEEGVLTRVLPVVEWHAQRYSELEVADLYKLLHQAVAGPAHAIEDPVAASQWLTDEWKGLSRARPGEARFEPLSADGTLVRVNLRPWRDAGRNPAEVLQAFLQTAEAFEPDLEHIRGELDQIAACVDRIAVASGMEAAAIARFFTRQANEGYPAIDHSHAYRLEYSPAYRVVLRSALD